MRLHEELDPHAEPVGRSAGQLTRDSVPHVEPQQFPLGPGVLQSEVVGFDDAELLAYLGTKVHLVTCKLMKGRCSLHNGNRATKTNALTNLPQQTRWILGAF